MDDKARIYEDISWLPEPAHRDRDAAKCEAGSGRARTLIGTAAVMAVAGAVGFGGAVLVHDSATASTTTVTTPPTSANTTPTGQTTSTLNTTTVAAPQTTTTQPATTSGGS
jgi:hypothetical protein